MRNKQHNLFSEQLEVKDTELNSFDEGNGTDIPVDDKKALPIATEDDLEPIAKPNDTINQSDNYEKSASYNPFPVDIFPTTFRNLINGLNDSLKFPVDYTGTAILTAMATAIGTTAKVKVKDHWFEFGSLYTCIIGNAGANKSHPLTTIFKPLKKIDKQSHDAYSSEIEDYNANLKVKQKVTTKSVLEPVLTKLILSNFTPEILYKRLNDNTRGCTVLSDELTSFFESMNNYSKSDNSSIYLSFWSNQAITIDRVGKPIPLFIETPCLSIIGGLQPRMLRKVFPPQKLNSGFFQRFLFAFPEGVNKEPINDNLLDPTVLQKYYDFITNYIKITSKGKMEMRVLNWSKKAKKYFYKWQAKNCDLVNDNLDNIKGEIISKFDNHFVRLALILQMMEDPKSTEVKVKAVKGANELCKYYMNCTFKVLAKIQNPKDRLNQLVDNKKQFYYALQNKFTTAEAIELGSKFNLSERPLKEFLKEPDLFMKVKHGNYVKKIKTQSSN
jgi:hypothetical protein